MNRCGTAAMMKHCTSMRRRSNIISRRLTDEQWVDFQLHYKEIQFERQIKCIKNDETLNVVIRVLFPGFSSGRPTVQRIARTNPETSKACISHIDSVTITFPFPSTGGSSLTRCLIDVATSSMPGGDFAQNCGGLDAAGRLASIYSVRALFNGYWPALKQQSRR